jgi:hypothetical protein
MERRGTPVTSLIADGVAESAAAQSAAAAAAGSADPVELDDTGFRAGSTGGGGGSGGCAAPMPAEVEEEEVGEEGEEGEEGKVGEEGEVGEVEVGEVGEGPRDPRRPWAGTKPALKPLDGITDEQASMFSVLSWGCRSSLPRPTRMRGSGSRLLCRGVAQTAAKIPVAACGVAAASPVRLPTSLTGACAHQRAVRRGGSARRCARTSAAPDRTETNPARKVMRRDSRVVGC